MWTGQAATYAGTVVLMQCLLNGTRLGATKRWNPIAQSSPVTLEQSSWLTRWCNIHPDVRAVVTTRIPDHAYDSTWLHD